MASLILNIILLGLAAPAAQAQELLLNRSFENPAAPASGNNFYATIPDWTVVNVSPAQAQPWNIVKAWSGYSNNPTVTPSGGGAQYLDINSASGSIRQTIMIPSNGMIDISGWFSVRDYSQNLSGLNINIRRSDGTLVATTSTSFVSTDPIGLWKKAELAKIPLTAGNYIFEADLPNNANVDDLSAVFSPGLSVSKTSIPFSDPVNGTNNPKFLPGGLVDYTIAWTTPANYSVTGNSIVLIDNTPTNSELSVVDLGLEGSGPGVFMPETSGLTYSFSSLSSSNDDIDFSNDGGVTWTYVPTANARGTDPLVTNIRIRPQGAMAANSTARVRLRYLIK